MTVKVISPTDLYNLHQESGGMVIVDVREKDEFTAVASTFAKNHPLSAFDAKRFAISHDKRSQIFVICRSGKRSLRAAHMLQDEGFTSVYNVEGGMVAWEQAGLPVTRQG